MSNELSLLSITTSYPTMKYPASGIFVRRFLGAFDGGVRHFVVAPKPQFGDELDLSLGLVKTCWYAPRRFRTLFHKPGGGPAALADNPLLFLLLPFAFFSLFLSSLFLARKVDVIHGHWSICGVMAGVVGKLAGKKSVVTLHGQDVNRSAQSNGLSLLLTLCVLLCDRVVTVSEGMAEELRARYPKAKNKILFISNGVNDDLLTVATQRQSSEWVRLVVVGSLIPTKGVDMLLRGIARLPAGAHVCLDVVGDGRELERLKLLCTQLGLGSVVRFIGSVSPELMIDVYTKADVLVSASYAEGRPSVVMEAMAASMPLILSDIDAHKELLEGANSGYLFDVGDEVDFSIKLAALVGDRSQMDVFAKRSKKYVVNEGILWSGTQGKYLKLYNSIFSGCSHSS